MSIDIEGKLEHLSELLGELLVTTSDTFGEHAANVAGIVVLQAPSAILFDGKPATQLLFGTEPYPIHAIRSALDPCTQGDPDEAKDLSEAFGRAKVCLTSTDMDASLGMVNGTIDDWEGTAADNFREYITRMNGAVENQILALDDAEVLTDALSQVVAGAHAGVHTLLDDSITQVEDAIKGKVIANIKATVGGVVAGTESAVSGNPSGLISWAVNTLVEKVITIAVGGDEDVPRAILDAANGLASGVADQVTAVEEKLDEVMAAIGAGADATRVPQVQPDKPTILEPVDFNPESFGLTDDKLRDGVEDDVSTEPLDAVSP